MLRHRVKVRRLLKRQFEGKKSLNLDLEALSQASSASLLGCHGDGSII